MKLFRILAFAACAAGLVLRLCLPAGEVCWHRDGGACEEAVPSSCCDRGQESPAPDDDGCQDCVDLRLEPVTAGSAASTSAAAPVVDSAVAVEPASVRIIAPVDVERSRGTDPGAGPPGRSVSIPLRC